MSDEELRALERDLANPASRRRYAQLLARLDLPPVPLEHEPKVLWRFTETMEDLGALHAGPFGVAVSVHNISHSWPPYVGGAPESECTILLDLETGARRATLSGVARGFAGAAVLCGGEESGLMRAFDAWTGEPLWKMALEPDSDFRVVGRRIVTYRWREGSFGDHRMFAFTDGLSPPEAIELGDIPGSPWPLCRKIVSAVEAGATYDLHEGTIYASNEGRDLWRFETNAVAIAPAPRKLIAACERGGPVFCLA